MYESCDNALIITTLNLKFQKAKEISTFKSKTLQLSNFQNSKRLWLSGLKNFKHYKIKFIYLIEHQSSKFDKNKSQKISTSTQQKYSTF